MVRPTRSPNDIALELAYAFGNDIDPLDHFEKLTRVHRHEQ